MNCDQFRQINNNPRKALTSPARHISTVPFRKFDHWTFATRPIGQRRQCPTKSFLLDIFSDYIAFYQYIVYRTLLTLTLFVASYPSGVSMASTFLHDYAGRAEAILPSLGCSEHAHWRVSFVSGGRRLAYSPQKWARIFLSLQKQQEQITTRQI